MSFESWIDKQIEKSVERGEFDGLPGAGKPLPIKDHYDPNWWAKSLLEREGLSFVPPALELRREVEEAMKAAEAADSEDEVRRIISEINARIRDALKEPVIRGPAIDSSPLDLTAALARWRAANQK